MSRPLISLIIPVWGDDDLVADLVGRVKFDSDLAEWVVAAVEPSEALRRLEDSGEIRLVVCGYPSRGKQLNAGAAQAHGTIFCFHHADSELRDEHLTALKKVAVDETVGGGAFHRRFSVRNTWYVGCEAFLRCFSPFAGPLFGDQSIFVQAGLFSKLGGFADIPLMEDLEFSRRMRRLTLIRLLDPPIETSPRRFHNFGIVRTSLLNILFVILFYSGISSTTLHHWYYRHRSKA